MIQLFPLVSVIIPVYNSEEYIAFTIDSVISQTYKELEIILIDDGSTDKSAEIIARYADGDNRIFYKRKQNQGPSLARKMGIDIAKGKYIQFLDSDDILINDAIELLVEKAESWEADIVAFPFCFCAQNGVKRESGKLQFEQISGVGYLNEILLGKAYWSLWSKFQKRSLLQESLIDIMPHISFGEDVIWTTQIVLAAKKIVSLNKAILNYNERPSSLSCIPVFSDEKFEEFKTYSRWIEDTIKQKGLAKELGESLAFFHLKNTFMMILWRRFDNIGEEMKRIIQDLCFYPNLECSLQYYERKVIDAYRFSTWFGNFKLMRYVRKGKI